jgi:plasmid replication initiation protein
MTQELIVKSNDILIHPIYKTPIELKIFSKIILELRKNPEESIFYLNKKDLLESFGCDKDSYGELKKVAERMFRPIDVNRGKGNFILRAVFLEINADIEGEIMFEVSPKMKPYFLNLTKNFTQYYFENIARLKSSFSIRIYELLKQYEKIGKIKKSLIDLRFFLNIEDNKYLKYNDFKRFIILTAQKELKEKTDIYFDFEEIKKGRKTAEINFIIIKNKKYVALTLDNEHEKESVAKLEDKTILTDDQKNLKLKLTTFGMSEKTANELVLSVKMEQIESNIVYAEKEHKNGKISKNLGGYLLDAIKNNYANNISLFELEAKKKATDKENEKRKKEMEDKKEALRSKFSLEFGRTEKDRFINLLNDKEKEDLKNEILEEISLDEFSVNSFKTKGLTSPAVGVYIIKRIPNFEKRREQFIAEKLKEAGLS